jgi:hypothetical protein
VEPGETTKTRDRAPGLDGVRALAVLIVIGFHQGATALPGGFLGVDIFFVLSGFLITDLLVSGYDRSGRMDLARFWTRRARRLLPALLRQLQQAVGPGRELVLVSTFGPQAWEHAVNTALAAAARRGQHTELANWQQAVAARPALLWPDGIHPRPAGARLYARVVLAAITAGRPSGQPPCPASPSGSA